MLWNELFIAIAGGTLGAITTLIGLIVQGRRRRRDGWWKRFNWAAEAYSSTDENLRAAAREVLQDLSEDRSADKRDRKMAAALLETRLTLHLTGSRSDVQIKV